VAELEALTPAGRAAAQSRADAAPPPDDETYTHMLDLCDPACTSEPTVSRSCAR